MTELDIASGHVVRNGTRTALVQLIEQRRHKLVRVAQRITGNQEEAEDIVQESTLKALLILHRFRGESQIDTWVYSIVTNQAICKLRSSYRRLSVSLDSELAGSGRSLLTALVNSREDPEQHWAHLELQTILYSEIEQLEPIYRSVIQLCDIEEHSYREAAGVLKLKVATMRARLFRGRKILRQRLCLRMLSSSARDERCITPKGKQ